MCSFSTIFGTYRFLRAPFGLCNLPELFHKLVYKYFGDIQGVTVYFDDICIATETKEEHDKVIKKVLERAKHYGVKFNFDKFKYCLTQIKYLGNIFCEEGVFPDPSKIEVIKKFPDPKNKNDLQKLLGMINYLRQFIPNLSEIISPLRELLKNNIVWNWSHIHKEALKKIRNIICSSQVLINFDPSLPITIQCDASKDAIGCCLLQNNKPVSFASRSLNTTETEYAQIEKELLAITYSCQKFHNYIYGHQNVTIYSDHKPLVSIITKDIGKIQNNRLRRLRLKLLIYRFDLKYLPGKYMYIADFLSRCNVKTEESEDVLMKDIVHCVSESVLQISDEKLKHFQQETLQDNILNQIIKFCMSGWPKSLNISSELNHFFKLRNEITLSDNLLYYNDRLIIPAALRPFMLNLLHETHAGISKISGTVKNFFYWPAILSDVKNLISSCPLCCKYRRSKRKEPLICHNIPEYPFLKLSVDIAEHAGKSYLVVMDYFSRWIEIIPIRNKSSTCIIEKLKYIFSNFGIPSLLISDNVPFKSYEFQNFSKEWNFSIQTCSPHYHQSNGLAEKAVDIAKIMIKKSYESKTDLTLFLLNYRNSIISTLGYSPAQLLQSRILRSKLPINLSNLKPKLMPESVLTKMKENQCRQKEWYDKNAIKESQFEKGENVLVQDIFKKTWHPAIIVDKCSTPRSYLVRLCETNNLLRRNTRFIKKIF